MTEKPLENLIELTSLATGDIIYVVDDPSGTPLGKKITVDNVFSLLDSNTRTFTNKTLTSPVLNTGVSGTAVLDEDDMSSDSATQLATQQSIKAYVDANVGISNVVDDTTPQLGGDLDGQDNNLDSINSLYLNEKAAANADIAGDGQVWVQTATPNLLMFTDDAGTDFQIATLTGTETLTNKTIDADNNTVSNIGDSEIAAHTTTKITTTNKSLLNSNISYIDQANSFGDFLQTFKDNKLKINSPDDADGVTIVNSDQTANRNLTIPVLTADDTIATLGLAQTFTQSQKIEAVNATLFIHSPSTETFINMVNETATPAPDTPIGSINLRGKNDAGTELNYGRIICNVTDDAAGAEISYMRLFVMKSGVPTEILRLNRNNDGVSIISGDKMYYDTGGDTYREEDASNDLGDYVGGAQFLRMINTAVDAVVSRAPDNAVVADASLFNESLSFYTADNGANMDLVVKYKDAGGVVRSLTIGTMT